MIDHFKKWDDRASEAAKKHPLKILKSLPNMPGITEETARFLKWKSLKWLLLKDENGAIRKGFLRHPIKYGWNYIKSVCNRKSYKRDGDLFLYGVDSVDSFKTLAANPDTIFVLGFSYCHKPLECPSGRFTPDCVHDETSAVCQQCFIGKCIHFLPKRGVIPLVIPTVHYIGEKIFEIVHAHPGKKVIFLITACEMTLEMFGDWGNMVGVAGIGVRLDGRICNTMRAFELSERGIKPGLTVVLDETQQRILEIIQLRSIPRMPSNLEFGQRESSRG